MLRFGVFSLVVVWMVRSGFWFEKSNTTSVNQPFNYRTLIYTHDNKHWHNFEYKRISEGLGLSLITDYELKEAFHNETSV